MRRLSRFSVKIVSVLLAVMIFSGLFSEVIPGTAIRAEAASYKALLWIPLLHPDLTTQAGKLEEYLSEISGVQVVKKTNTTVLSASDLSGVQFVYLLYTDQSSGANALLGANEGNVSLLSSFVNAGGRIVMNGENSGSFSSSNAALSTLAAKMGANFTISQSAGDYSSATTLIMSTEHDAQALIRGCNDIRPGYYTHIVTNGNNVVLLMYDANNKVFAVDQPAGKGHITAIADVDWLYPTINNAGSVTVDTVGVNAAKQFVKNLLEDSVKGIQNQNIPAITSGPESLSWVAGDTTPRTLTVSATSPNGGTLSYQWHSGNNASFTPDDNNKVSGANGASYSIPSPESVPAGKYYYRVVVTNTRGGSSYSVTSNIATITVTPKNVQPDREGVMKTGVEKREDTPDIKVEGLTEELAWEMATPEEQQQIKSSGATGKLWLEITNIDKTVDATDRQLIENHAKALNDGVVGMYLDMSMLFRLGAGNARKISSLNGKSINVKVTVPMSMAPPSNKKRTFYLISVHNGIPRIHGSSTTNVIPAKIMDFSTYAIAYADEEEEVFKTSITIKQTEEKIIVNWDKVAGVGKVEVYVAYCGTKYSPKPSQVTTKTKVTIKKINGKKLDQKRNYKMLLVAYDKQGNKVGKSLPCHFGGKNCKYTNPKSLKLSKKSVTLSVGQSTKVTGKIKYEDKKKKKLSKKHAARLRFVSEDPTIATVDKSGNIMGVSPGTCIVYVVCQNGLSKKVKVTVNG